MPQLNPSPWLLTLLLSWVVVLLVFKTKVVTSTPHSLPTPPDLTTSHTTSWNWPWI
uniref:ATP synthase complex subunit 8 n=1 Tax=Brachymeles samarensis TaxID=979829 RepID=F2YES2_9SAUR|nr:ATPase 8 [Brachymeles samarensis]